MTQAVGRSCCGRSDSSVLEFGFQFDPLVCSTCLTLYVLIYDLRKIGLASNLPERNCTIIKGSVRIKLEVCAGGN